MVLVFIANILQDKPNTAAPAINTHGLNTTDTDPGAKCHIANHSVGQ